MTVSHDGVLCIEDVDIYSKLNITGITRFFMENGRVQQNISAIRTSSPLILGTFLCQ